MHFFDKPYLLYQNYLMNIILLQTKKSGTLFTKYKYQ